MSTTFSLEIIYMTHTKIIDVESIDITSCTGGFYIGPQSAPLASILGKNSKLVLKLPSNIENEIIIPAGVLTINYKGNVSIVTLDPNTMNYLDD